jgi:NMD protein affecting ribosome stability and mRNA decay
MSAYRNGVPVYTTMELMADYGTALDRNNLCGCCGKATLYAIRYPDRATLFICRYCDTEKRGT